MIRRMPESAIYQRIAAALRTRIEAGEFGPGQPIGSEKALAHEYDVSPATIGAALDVLKRAGLVVREPGQVARVGSQWPVVEVGMRLGSVVRFREATADEREDLEVGDGIMIAEVEYPDRVEVYVIGRILLVYI